MIIHALRILSYGKFKNKTITFGDGINYIYGENEAGKSTVMAFIKAMLYGFSGRGAEGDRKKYTPWEGGKLSGEMDVTLGDGRRVILRRTSGRTQAQDEFVCLDAVTGETCAVDLEAEIGVGESAFVKTVYIRQMASELGGGDDELTDKLINLATSGSEDTGYEDAMKNLTDQMRLLKHQRGDGGQISALKKEISDLTDAIEKAKEENDKYFAYVTEEKIIKAEIDALQRKIKLLKEELRLAEAGKTKTELEMAEKKLSSANEKRKEAESALCLAEEKQKQLSVFENEIADVAYLPTENVELFTLQKEQTAKSQVLLSIGALVTILAGIIFLLFQKLPIGIGCAGIGLLLFLLGIKQVKTKKDIEKKVEASIKNEEARKTALSAFGCVSLKEYTEKRAEKLALDEMIQSLREKHVQTVEDVKNAQVEFEKYQEAMSAFAGSVPSQKDAEQILKEIELMQKQLSEKMQRAATVGGVLQGAQGNKKAADLLLTERRFAEQALAEKEEEYAALLLASDTLEEVFTELSRDFTPRINEKASYYLSVLTGKEETLLIDKNFNVIMGRDEHRPLKVYSGGTIDQAFLAVRIAIADFVLGSRNIPLFLDDIFMQYDIKREENAFRLLQEIAKEKQVILFSCRMRESENMTSIKL